jgi:hypothetical protein
MKTKLALLLSIVLTTILFSGSGCTSLNKETGQKEYDAAKTERVKRRIAAPIQTGVHFLLTKKKAHAPEIAAYIGDARNIFCKMVETKTVSHEAFLDEADKLGTPALVKKLRDSGDDDLAILILSGKAALVGLLDEALADASTDIDPERWPYQVASLFCDAFTTALKDEGY